MNYAICNLSVIDSIDFSTVKQTSKHTVRKNLENTKFLVKYEGDMPDCVSSIEYEGPYTKEQILPILSGTDWEEEL
jgi:hypothetical protein